MELGPSRRACQRQRIRINSVVLSVASIRKYSQTVHLQFGVRPGIPDRGVLEMTFNQNTLTGFPQRLLFIPRLRFGLPRETRSVSEGRRQVIRARLSLGTGFTLVGKAPP